MKAIINAKVFTGTGFLEGHTVFARNGEIERITSETPSAAYEIIDAKQQYLLPGFIDLQIYGSGGNLFSAYPTPETLRQMDENLTAKGTTSFMACVATNTAEIVDQAITAAKAYRSTARGFLGLHLEGPYLNPKRLGAHIPELARKATLDEVKALLDKADGVVKIMTIAPELQEDEVINYLIDNGVVISLGHSDATFEEATEAYNKGVKTTTHLFNAMSPIHHRTPGIPTAVFNHEKAMASIIADGNHVSFEVIRMAHNLLRNRLFLITDAVTACNTGPYQHRLEGDKFVTAEGILSGSNVSMAESVKNCVDFCGISLTDAVNMAAAYPAKVVNLEKQKGSIAAGLDADLVLIDQDLRLLDVFRG